MVFDARKYDLVACEQQRRRSACAFAQSDQRLCYSLSGKNRSQTCSNQNFNGIVSVTEQAGLSPTW